MIHNFLNNISIIFSAYCDIRTNYIVCVITIKDSLFSQNTLHNSRYDSSHNISAFHPEKNCHLQSRRSQYLEYVVSKICITTFNYIIITLLIRRQYNIHYNINNIRIKTIIIITIVIITNINPLA